MGKHSDSLKEGAVQTLGDAVELGGVMRGEFSHRPRCCQVCTECCTQVLTPTVGSQDFDLFAVILGERPRLKGLVGLKSLAFGVQQEAYRVTGGVIREGDEVVTALAGRGVGWSPDIGVYLITKVC